MKKIAFWAKIVLSLLFLLALLMLFFQNRDTTIVFNYLAGKGEIQLTTLLFLSFALGAIFTLAQLFLTNVRKGYNKMILEARVKELTDENERLERELNRL